MENPELTIVIPAFNEAENIAVLLDRLSILPIPCRITVVDDHSTDTTAREVSKKAHLNHKVRLMINPGTQGYAQAVLAGFDSVTTEFGALMMADLGDDPKEIPLMLDAARSGADVVCGSRYSEGGDRVGGPIIKGLLSRWGGWFFNAVIGVPTRDGTNAYKLFRMKRLREIVVRPASYATPLQMLLKLYFRGAKVSEIPTIWHEREIGSSKFRLMKIIAHYAYWVVWAIVRKIVKSEQNEAGP